MTDKQQRALEKQLRDRARRYEAACEAIRQWHKDRAMQEAHGQDTEPC